MKDFSHNYKQGRGGGMTGHKSNPEQLPSDRNPGQKNHLGVQQNYTPAPGSPTPTQAGPGARGKL